MVGMSIVRSEESRIFWWMWFEFRLPMLRYNSFLWIKKAMTVLKLWQLSSIHRATYRCFPVSGRYHQQQRCRIFSLCEEGCDVSSGNRKLQKVRNVIRALVRASLEKDGREKFGGFDWRHPFGTIKPLPCVSGEQPSELEVLRVSRTRVQNCVPSKITNYSSISQYKDELKFVFHNI